MLTDGKAMWIAGGTTRYVLVVMGATGTHLAVQKLVLLNSDGKILDTLACSINGRYGTLGTETFLNAQSDGAQVVIRFHPYPGNKSAWHNWHHITHGTQSVMYRERDNGSPTAWDTQGLCRASINNGRFEIGFPQSSDVYEGQGGYYLNIPAAPVAGQPYHGLLVSLDCKKSYRTGKPVLFKVIEKNTGEQTLRYAFYRFPYYYHLYLTDAQGKPVEKTAETIVAEYEEDHITAINRPQSDVKLKPGEEKVRTYDLRQYFKSIPAGSYTLQVRRTARDFIGFTPGATDQGALSLPCQFSISE